MLTNFRTYQLAVQFYKACSKHNPPRHLKDQLLRAASSVVLNLSEGSARGSAKDRKRFYVIAFASHREVQAILELDEGLVGLVQPADQLAACLYKLTRGV